MKPESKTTNDDAEIVRKALKRLKEYGVENLIRSGYSPADACKISDRTEDELPAFERLFLKLQSLERSEEIRNED